MFVCSWVQSYELSATLPNFLATFFNPAHGGRMMRPCGAVLPRSGGGRLAPRRSAVFAAHGLRTRWDLTFSTLQKSVSALNICFSIIIYIVCRALCRGACRDVCR